MYLKLIFVFCIVTLTHSVIANKSKVVLKNTGSIKLADENGPGSPLFLTKYIEEGKLEEARHAAMVKPFVEHVKSFSGYLTVNKKYNSNLFFWYFPSEVNYKDAPTVVWLQGGPGSSMYLGLFNEHGPFIINKNKTIHKRKYTWSKISNLIYFDNPVGTGYSFTDNKSGYATNQTKVGADLYQALIQLYKLFPYMQKNDLFLTGESYGGKYVPALGHTIHERNKKSDIFLNLKGLMIGNGLSDPIHMLKYADYLYQLGLIDKNAWRKFHKLERKGVKLIKQRKWNKASQLFDKVVGNETSLLYKHTGFKGVFNYINPNANDWPDWKSQFITSDHFRRSVHVGNLPLNDGSEVYKHLYNDIPKSVINWVVKLLQDYRILYYNGQLDIICAYPLTENVLQHMKWPLSREYKKAKRYLYKVGGDIAGYYKTVGNLTEVLIRDAGHMVPANQPVWAFQLFNDFLNNKFSADTNFLKHKERKLLQNLLHRVPYKQ